MADYTKYTNKEMQAITLAQQITNDNIAIVGTGLPLIGASVAKRLFAPKCNLIVESGLMDCSPIEVPRSVGDLRFMAHCRRSTTLQARDGLTDLADARDSAFRATVDLRQLLPTAVSSNLTRRQRECTLQATMRHLHRKTLSRIQDSISTFPEQ